MESLESKLDRLPPDQRKEVEEFVDFLLYRSGNLHESSVAPASPDLRNVAPPPLVFMEQAHAPENPPVKVYGSSHGENSSPTVKNEEQATPITEIMMAGSDEQGTREYMDYGQFEQKSSPATSAVKNVKEKLQKREEREKPRVSLDWID
jgi:hypothetical protein